jgi:BirA family biotin operon repressor/biotin-[acetyl-CoA-carboxylase] ligase
MKSRILSFLRSAPDVISGEFLKVQLGISRVAIWKHIHKLQALGYQIEATPKGYRLHQSPDALYPWEFEGYESLIHYYDEIPSTMDVARDLARKGCPHMAVVIAERQGQGRGRLQRTWHSSPGGLYFTVVLRPHIPPALSPRVNLAASLYLAQVLKSMYGIDARVKWPNDIMVAGQKISGMLAEMEAEIDQVRFISVGIGLNVNNDPPADLSMAVSIKQLLGHAVRRKGILMAFLQRLEKGLDTDAFESVITEWKKISVTLNRQVRVVTHQSVYEGTAIDVDDHGALVLQNKDGTTQTIFHGDCFNR